MDNDDLDQLYLGQSHPVIYVDHYNTEEACGVIDAENDVGQSIGGGYVPWIDILQSEAYIPSVQIPQLDDGLEAIQRYASFDWFADAQDQGVGYSGSSYQHEINVPDHTWGSSYQHETTLPDRTWGSSYQHETTVPEWPSWDHQQTARTNAEWGSSYPRATDTFEAAEAEHDDTYEYVPSSNAETASDASEDYTEERHINFTAAEFAGWVRREGGLGRLFSLVNERNQEIRDGDIADAADLSNWLVPVIPLDAAASLVALEHDPSNLVELANNSYYNSKDELVIAVGLWNMQQGAESKVVKSDRGRIYFKCKHSDKCPFDLRASCHGGDMWGVYKFDNEHRCQRDLGRVKHINAHAKVVAAYVARKVQDDPEVMKPKSILAELKREYGISILYDLALRARNMVIEMLYGRYVESFHLLPKYLYMLQQTNPSSKIDFQVGHDGRLRHVFIALGACVGCFYFSLRLVIVMDGTHLKGKNRGILFVAVTKDANEQVFPLAYGVGPIENDESWKWFLSRIRHVYGNANPLLVVSNAHISIANAIRSELTHATHGLCYYHLLNKIKGYGKAVAEIYRKVAYAYDRAEFTRAMSTLKEVNVNAYNKLVDVRAEKWARSMCPVKRYSFLTSNAAETFNARLLWARRLPICSMLEAVRLVIEQWFSERLAAAQSSDELLTEEAIRKLSTIKQQIRRYTAKRTTDMKYKVRARDRHFMVDLRLQTCECCEFNLDGIPCSHAIAAISEAGESIHDYVDNYYTKSYLVNTYSSVVNHLPPRENWNLPEDVENSIVLPLAVEKQAGRPRMTRYRTGPDKTTQRGNQRQTDEATSSKKRAPKRCSVCGEPGHTRRSCAGRAEDLYD